MFKTLDRDKEFFLNIGRIAFIGDNEMLSSWVTVGLNQSFPIALWGNIYECIVNSRKYTLAKTLGELKCLRKQ